MPKIFLEGHPGKLAIILIITYIKHTWPGLPSLSNSDRLIFLLSYFSENRCWYFALLVDDLALANLWQRNNWAFRLVTMYLIALLNHCNRWYRYEIFKCLIATEVMLFQRNLILFSYGILVYYIERRLWLNQDRVVLIVRMLVVSFDYFWHRVTIECGHELILRTTHKFLYLLILQKSLWAIFLKSRISLDFLLNVISRHLIFLNRFLPFWNA